MALELLMTLELLNDPRAVNDQQMTDLIDLQCLCKLEEVNELVSTPACAAAKKPRRGAFSGGAVAPASLKRC